MAQAVPDVTAANESAVAHAHRISEAMDNLGA